jgi:endonuclease YncB( thermonuclease family)
VSLLAVLTLAVALGAAGCGDDEPDSTSGPLQGEVRFVYDGDTLQVHVHGGETERVRLLGIDTPEREECLYRRATDSARELTLGEQVMIVFDESQPERDRFGRLLAYVELENGQDVAETQLERGFAQIFDAARPFEREDAYDEAEDRGRLEEPSIWRTCG